MVATLQRLLDFIKLQGSPDDGSTFKFLKTSSDGTLQINVVTSTGDEIQDEGSVIQTSTIFINFKGDTIVATANGAGADITVDSYSVTAENIASTSGAGSSSDISRGDHTHKGVFTVKKAAGADIHGTVTVSEGSGITITQVGNDLEIASPGSGTDEKVKVSSNDTTADFLFNKLASGAGISLLELNDGADEDVEISIDHSALDYGEVGDLSVIEPDDAATAGVLDEIARADHQHAIVADVAGTIEPDDAAAEGVATSFARSDHKHAIVAESPLDIGSANAEGSATSFVRSDHVHEGVHTIKKTAGADIHGDITLSEGANVTLTQVGNDIEIASAAGGATGLNIKADTEIVGNFTGNPKQATVTFTAAYADANYSVTANAVTGGTKSFIVTILSKTASGFTLALNSNTTTDLVEVNWISSAYGEE